jgi:putative salt-induced outer membrane protein
MNKTLLVIGLITSGVTFAEDEKQQGWSGTGQLGITYASGNADTDSINAGLNLKKESNQWIHQINLTALRASTNSDTTAERYTLIAKSGYKFNDNNYIFTSYRNDHDAFSGLDYSQSLAFGWGHKFFDTKESKLITEFGAGYKVEAIDIDRSQNKGAVITAKMDYMRKITATTSFDNVLYIESTSDNTFLQNDAGFSFKVNDAFSVKLAHQWRHNTDVPEGREKTDTLFSANLVYGF